MKTVKYINGPLIGQTYQTPDDAQTMYVETLFHDRPPIYHKYEITGDEARYVGRPPKEDMEILKRF